MHDEWRTPAQPEYATGEAAGPVVDRVTRAMEHHAQADESHRAWSRTRLDPFLVNDRSRSPSGTLHPHRSVCDFLGGLVIKTKKPASEADEEAERPSERRLR